MGYYLFTLYLLNKLPLVYLRGAGTKFLKKEEYSRYVRAYKKEKTIEVTVIEIDGKEYDAKQIMKFFELAGNFKSSIGQSDDWTSEYFYFETYERDLELLLRTKKVIRLNPWYKYQIQRSDLLTPSKKFLLDEGYEDFYRKVWDELNKVL